MRIFHTLKIQYQKQTTIVSLILLFILTELSSEIMAQPEANLFLEFGSPKGSFGDNTSAFGLGGGLNILSNLDKKRQILVGGEFNYEIYGKKIGSINTFDVITNNNILMIHGVIRYMPALKSAIRPYLDIKGGLKSFSTTTKVKENILAGDPIERTEDFNDTAGSYGGGIGIIYKKGDGGGVFVEASYMAGGNASYLDKKSITSTPDGEILFTPRSSKTNMLLLRIGVNIPFSSMKQFEGE